MVQIGFCLTDKHPVNFLCNGKYIVQQSTISSMKSQTAVPCGIKFYGSLQNYSDKKFTDFNFMDTQFCSLVLPDCFFHLALW